MFEDIVEFCDHFLSAAARMTDDEITERYRACPRAFIGVFRKTDDALQGYFVLLPLNEAGVQAIRDGRVSSGRQITTEYLASSDSEAKAVYLSVVCATQARARAFAVSSIIGTLRSYYHRHQVRHLFVRAATAAGSRMLQRLIRTPFSPDGVIHEVDLTQYTAITRAIES
jgi:hypothetical protein